MPDKLSILERATPFPWGRDQWGNLIGTNGEAVYFAGVDSVLVEYAPVLLKCLLDICRAAGLGHSDPVRRLELIRQLADTTITNVTNHPFCNPEISQAKLFTKPGSPKRNRKR